MRSRLGVAPVALALACSPGAPGDLTGTSTGGDASTGPAPTSGVASTDTGSTTDAGPITGDASTTPDDTTTGDTTDETTGADATTGAATTTTGETGSTSETTGALAPITKAWWIDGVDLQIRVIQEDSEAGLCRGVILEREGVVLDEFTKVATPPTWGVRDIFVHAGPGACLDPYDWWQNQPAFAADATGTAVFHDVDGEGKPASLDLDIAATYLPGEPWTPSDDALTVSAVPVDVG